LKEDRKKIGEILIDAGIINSMQLSAALGEQRQWGGRLCSIIVRMGFADERAITQVLEKQLGVSCISLDNRQISPDTLKKVKIDVARKYGIIPIEIQGLTLTVAMSDPTDLGTVDELDFILGMRIRPVLALESGIRKAISFHYEGIAAESKSHKGVLETSPKLDNVLKDERYLTHPIFSERAVGSQVRTEQKEIPVKTMIEALVSVLLEKGLITKEELMKKINEKGG
jgi:type IV pilus assembly protein PilB